MRDLSTDRQAGHVHNAARSRMAVQGRRHRDARRQDRQHERRVRDNCQGRHRRRRGAARHGKRDVEGGCLARASPPSRLKAPPCGWALPTGQSTVVTRKRFPIIARSGGRAPIQPQP
eukprot:366083-Chlamydomonas_euryale.AAC.25